MEQISSPVASILRAVQFAAAKHRDQRRKGAEASPYINHVVEVAETLAQVGVADTVTLQAALLHDTLEDTVTTGDELEQNFGAEVRAVVEEMTDDKSLPKDERKRLQIEHAPRLSARARLIKVADKISNIRSVVHMPPTDWPEERRREYLDWTEQVVAGCRGSSPELERLYDQVLREGRAVLQPKPAG